MKGIVFNVFLGFVEAQFGDAFTEELIIEANLASDGAYTNVGTYNHSEILSLVGALAEKTGAPVNDLVHGFGKHLFGALGQAHGELVEPYDHVFDFLEAVDQVIHVTVRKIHNDAELPDVIMKERSGKDSCVVSYRSTRPFAVLAKGLLEASIDHFGTPYTVTAEYTAEDYTAALFTLKAA